ncbi:hypothetical protein ACWKTZ_25140 [Bacillus cereus]
MEKKETSYQKLKRTVAQKDEQISHFKTQVKNLKHLSVGRDVEYAVLKEAFELLGGHEAIDKKVAEAKQLQERQRAKNGLMKSEKIYMQNQHNKELKAKSALLKEEYTYSQKGHEFDRNLTIEERKSKINDAVDKDKLYAKMFDSIERKEKWEKRVEPIKKAAETMKNVSKAAVKTANDLVVNPVKKQVNEAVVVPANLSMKMMKEDLNKEMNLAKDSLNKEKEKVIGFGKTVKAFANKANKSLKTMVMKHTVLNKSQEKEAKNEQELSDIKWGSVVARASMSISESLSDKLSSKFSKLKAKVTQNYKDSVAKTKETFTQHLHAEKEKQNEKTKSREKGGAEL